jgi:hypothetical protein
VTNRSKAKGTAAESAVARVMRANGWPDAERSALHGAKDRGDLTGIGQVCVEVKGGHAAEQASDGQVLAWMAELDTECVNKGADVGVLVMKRKGVGHGNAERWWAVMWLHDIGEAYGFPHGPLAGIPVRMTLADACRVLRALGYSEGAR